MPGIVRVWFAGFTVLLTKGVVCRGSLCGLIRVWTEGFQCLV